MSQIVRRMVLRREGCTADDSRQCVSVYCGGRGTLFSTGALSTGGRGTCGFGVGGAVDGFSDDGPGPVTGVWSPRLLRTTGACWRRLTAAAARRLASAPWMLASATSVTDSPTISWWPATLTAAWA